MKARILGALLLAAGVLAPSSLLASEPTTREAVEARIAHYAAAYGIPYALLHKVVKSESTFNPAARNGPYWGLMQIRHDTAKGLGYAGSATGLLDAETNLIYGGAYLANAYMIAGGNSQQAHNLYRKGYYYEAKRKRLLSRLLKIPMGMVPVMVAGQTVAQPKTGGEIAAPVLLASSESPEPAALRPAPAIVADAPMIKPVARPVLARAAVAEAPIKAEEMAALVETPLLPRRRPAAPSRLAAAAETDTAKPRGLLYATALKPSRRLAAATAAAAEAPAAGPELALAGSSTGFASLATAAALSSRAPSSGASRLPTAIRLAASPDGKLPEAVACCETPAASALAAPLPRTRPKG